jgi:hypothetical protein
MKTMLVILSSIFSKLMVIGMIVFSTFTYPEASRILNHYCFGNGDTLMLDTSYLKVSPVIVKELKTMKVGETKIVRFTQKDDWRLSYAINGFTLIKKKHKVIVKQYIEFDKTGEIYTDLNLGVAKLRVDDGFVHTFDCTPYWVYSEFSR